jgi:hypothetical protein
MGLLRSICCLFGDRCAEEEPKPSTEAMRREAPGNLGQREAERERASEDQLRGMESSPTRTQLMLTHHLTERGGECANYLRTRESAS